jgi:hypothetical protein
MILRPYSILTASVLLIYSLVCQSAIACNAKETPVSESVEIISFAKKSIAATVRRTSVPAIYNKVYVNTIDSLYSKLEDANNAGGNTAIYLSNGHYEITKTLQINKPNILLLSHSGDPKKVVLSGPGMQSQVEVFHILLVASHGIVVDGMTFQNASHHLIQVQGEKNADNFILRNCVLQDSYQQLIKITASNGFTADNGYIENCIFQYSEGIGPNWYIGGIDAHGATNWIVQNNLFLNIKSPKQRISEHAVHFWNKSKHNIVRNNFFVDNDRAIGFGMKLKSRADRTQDNIGGSIHNNLIYHSSKNVGFADVGIIIENSPDTVISNNFIYQLHKYPNAIEFRFDDTDNVTIENNTINRNITSRSGAKATLRNNKKLNSGLMQKRMREILIGT